MSGDFLKMVRKALGMTREDVSQKTGINPCTLNGAERNAEGPPSKRLWAAFRPRMHKACVSKIGELEKIEQKLRKGEE